MRGRADPSVLAEIAKLRELQYQSVVAQVARAASALRAREDALGICVGERDMAGASWQALVSAPSVPIDMLRVWSGEFARCDLSVKTATREVEHAARDVKRLGEEMHLASKRRDLAEWLFLDVRAVKARKREDDALQESLDRIAYQGRAF
jgi:hypothetical protein